VTNKTYKAAKKSLLLISFLIFLKTVQFISILAHFLVTILYEISAVQCFLINNCSL